MGVLDGRTLYVPEMGFGGASMLAASFRSLGIKAKVVPPSTKESLELGTKETSGDECYPQRVTLGDFLAILKENDPKECAFFMPTAEGPCRFGQYVGHTRNVLKKLGLDDAVVFSLTSEDGYGGVADEGSRTFERSLWNGIVASDILQQMLHRIRPFEKISGETDRIYLDAVASLERVIEAPSISFNERKRRLKRELLKVRKNFRHIETTGDPSTRPLIGVVGEIFCRLNTFSNDDLVRKIEEAGGWCWVSNVSEWILYTTFDQQRKLKLDGKGISKPMILSKLRYQVLRRDEHDLFDLFHADLKGCENISDIGKLLEYSKPYLPYTGALGEMTINAANTVHFSKKGAAGVIDISPFSCMNGIICEAVYPKLSEDLGGFPIRVFYFDGLNTNLDRDIGIFLELARTYKK